MISLPGEPSFIEHSSRRLFVIRYSAKSGIKFKGAVLHLPAFGEEMNKSRAMVALQARALAGDGYNVLVPDYYGTGDSGGDFSESSWAMWLEDMRYCLRYLQAESTGQALLWGLRLGALMAVELASDRALDVGRLLLWNPVLSGEQYMIQFLRLRLVNSMMYGVAKEKVADLKNLLEDDGILEVSGYELSNTLFNEVCSKKTTEFKLSSVKDIYWAEVTPAAKTLSLPAQQLARHWQAEGLNVQIESVMGPHFWATQEISQAQQLIETSSQWLSDDCTVIKSSSLEND